MTLTPGTRLGAFEIKGALGAGGMGEVYRAHDSRLRREVAVKVLPGDLAADADRVARFRREATILASLNHPNIASIYGLEEAGGAHALVLELVEGPTLAERIRSGPIPLAGALAIAAAIADALEAAHDSGIVHRDLKPANIKVRTDGAVKVLDFGLAKALHGDADAASADEPTTTQFATGRGLLLGTAAYMSPEQARGDQVDRRADIWAFGCVLYEMLTGRRTFLGDRTADIVAAVMREEPDWQQLPNDTPPAIRRLLRRCLEKDPRARLRDIGDARLEIRDAGDAGEAAVDPIRAAPASNRRAWQGPGPWIAAALIAGLAGGIVVWNGRTRPADGFPPPVVRLSMTFPGYPFAAGPSQALYAQGLVSSLSMALSPDGTRLVYIGSASDGDPSRLYIRPLAEFEPRPLNGTQGASAPFFSPDGRSVGFFASGKLKRIDLGDEAVATVCDAPENTGGSGGAWGPDDIIVFAVASIARAGLFRVAARGGTPEPLTTPDPNEEGGHGEPSMVAGGRAVLFNTRQTKAGVPISIRVLSLDTGQHRKLLEGGLRPRYVNSGHLVYTQNQTIVAAPFDAGTLELTGRPATIIERVDVANFAVSSAGRLVYHPATARGGRLVWVDRQGAVEPILGDDRAVGRPRLSPDGRRVVMEVFRESRQDIGVYQFDNGTVTLLTTDGVSNSPYWHPDGRRVVFRAPGGLYWQSANGTTPREQFLAAADPHLKGTSELAPGVFTPDGSTYAFVVHGSTATAADIWTVSMGRERRAGPAVQRPGNQWAVRISPDGRWISYASDESARFEIYVESIAGGGPRYQVSNEGGREAVWSHDGTELFFRNGTRLLSAPVLRQDGSFTGAPTVLFTGLFGSTDIPYYDVSRDGKRFLMVKPLLSDMEAQTVRVVEHWFEDLKRLAPAGR